MPIRNCYLTFACLLTMPVVAYAADAAKPQTPTISQSDFNQCLARLQHGGDFANISDSTWKQYTADLTPDGSILPLLDKQPEFTLPAWDYLAMLVDNQRVADGRAAYKKWRPTLEKIQQRYGVNPAIVVSVWGVESNFGQNTGGRPLTQSLGTLSCFGRRQDFFRKQFAAALQILQNGDIAPDKLSGSWAGAFGQTQFMPGTFLQTAVDFDGDGRRDLVDNVPDALASTANFLKRASYRQSEPWGMEVKLSAGYTGASGRKTKHDVAYWSSRGIRQTNGKPLPANLPDAGLLLPTGKQGPAFLTTKNFDTLYSYNASENYALAIAQLATLVGNSKTDIGFATPWPTDDPGLSRSQNRQLQNLLLKRGYDIGEADGMIGSKTRDAIRAEQAKLGMPVDGRAGQKMLAQLRAHPAR